MESKSRYYIPLAITLALSSELFKIEQKWMCHPHGILQLPCSLIETVVLPLHLYLTYGSVPEHCDIIVEDVHRLDLELSLGFHLNHISIYHMLMIMYTFIKKRNMKNIMSSTVSRKCNSIWKWTILSSTSNDLQYIDDNLEKLPNFKEIFIGLTQR